MTDLKSRLQGLNPAINQILKISGAAGASIGVIHENEEPLHLNFGYRDVVAKLPPNEHTLYHVASLSKSFTASALGILVHEQKLAFEDSVCSLLESFSHTDSTIRNNATILDFLSHRTGLATKQSLWAQDGQDLLLEKSDSMPIVSYLEVIKPLGQWFNYNNWGYDVAANIVERVSGKSWGDYVSENIIKPLQLERTFVNTVSVDNYAMGYMQAPDGEWTSVGRPTIANGTVQQGANGIKTTLSDLLRYYRAILRAWRAETLPTSGLLSSPLKRVKELLTGHISIDSGSSFNQSYGAGWAIVDLPSPVGAIGTNGMFVDPMPTLGKGTKRKKLWYHNGSLVGFFSSVHIIPDTGTIVVVLVNSMPKNDAADWIGQLLVETILDNTDKNDYVALARQSAASYDAMWKRLSDDLQKSKDNATNNRNLEEYVGKYYNEPKLWFIEVTLENGVLFFGFQGLAAQKHRLHHHGIDKFSWPVSEEQSRCRGRWPDLDASTYVFKFDTDKDGCILALRWVHDPDVPEGEAFKKESKQISSCVRQRSQL